MIAAAPIAPPAAGKSSFLTPRMFSFSFVIVIVEFVIEVLFLEKLNGTLLSLAPQAGNSAGGLRRYLKANADQLGLTGYVVGIKKLEIELCFEGTTNQVGEFLNFLACCKNQGLVTQWRLSSNSKQVNGFRTFPSFDVLEDWTMLVKRGLYSGNDFDRNDEESQAGAPAKKGCTIV